MRRGGEEMKFKKLKGLMMERGYSQSKLSQCLGITVQTFNAKLNGRSKFTLSEVVRIVDILEIEDLRAYFF